MKRVLRIFRLCCTFDTLSAISTVAPQLYTVSFASPIKISISVSSSKYYVAVNVYGVVNHKLGLADL